MADKVYIWFIYCINPQAGKKVKSYSGFKGKGFKFDETEAHLADERRKLQKAALGLQDSDDEDCGVDVGVLSQLKYLYVRIVKYIQTLNFVTPGFKAYPHSEAETLSRIMFHMTAVAFY